MNTRDPNVNTTNPIFTSEKRPVSSTRTHSTHKLVGAKRKSESCVICLQYCTFTSSMKPEGCEHAICDACLRAYYQTALNDVRYHSFEEIQCPNPDCEALLISEKVTQNIFSAKQRDDWWTAATVKTFVENKVCFISLINPWIENIWWFHQGWVPLPGLQSYLWCRCQVDQKMHFCWMLWMS